MKKKKNSRYILKLFQSLILLVCGLNVTQSGFAATSTIQGPWMTGPLLAPAGHTLPKGHINIEPYLFYTDDYGFYNNIGRNTQIPTATSISPTMVLTYGLTNWMDIEASVPYNFNSSEDQNYNGVGDTALTLGFQLLTDKPGTWIPDLRFTVDEVFPTGKYNNLNPVRVGVDAMGAGAYQTSLATNFQKLKQFSNGKYLRSRLSLSYTIPSSTHVSGLNAFGGTSNTDGRITLSNRFNADLGLEYTLTQHWVPALDVMYTYTQKSKFSGFPGTTSTGSLANIGYQTGDIYTLAPAMEYNFNSNIGVIAGPWFSYMGRNKPDFISGVVALNIYY